MKILIMTLGSRGDVQPYLALANGLVKAGHDISFCTCGGFEQEVQAIGVPFLPIRNDILDFLDTAAGHSVMEEAAGITGVIRTWLKLKKLMKPIQQGVIEDCWDAVQKTSPDVIVFHPKTFGAPSFAEKCGANAVLVTPFPAFVSTGEFPAAGFPALPLGRWYNRLTYRIINALFSRMSGSYVEAWRSDNGLAPLTDGLSLLRMPDGDPLPVLHAYSPSIIPNPDDWPEQAMATGYCFLEQESSWTPDPDLARFLEKGPPPVYVGFGSMTGKDPKRLTHTVIEALDEAGYRGLLATNWGGLADVSLPDHIYRIREAPHDWLFPKVAAAVHHGGAGTTAAALRAGIPSVICPFFGDQPFWARRISELGVGTGPLPQKTLNPKMLASAIRRVLEDENIRQKAAGFGTLIRAEDGVRSAVCAIERVSAKVPEAKSIP